jgi:spermidine synthase
LILLYLLSGFAGLLYEITWSRLLALQLGHTSGAISTVLAAFMGGLAAGAFFGGRAASRLTPAQALRAYACLELLVAACAIALPLVLRAAGPILGGLYGDGPSAIFAIARIAFCLALVSIPAALMGATYPIAIRGCQALPRGGRAERVLYASNAAGAALGAVATGFVLLPALGAAKTIWLGVLVNVIAAAGAIYLARQATIPVSKPGKPRLSAIAPKARRWTASPKPSRKLTDVPARPVVAAVGLFTSGLVALLCEVAWTRVFAMVLGPTIYAFSTMLVAFIGGIAIGASLGVRLCVGGSAAARLAWCLAVVGISTAAALFAVDELPLLIGRWVAFSDGGFVPLIVTEAVLAAALLLPATVALGAVFPLGLALGVPSGPAAAAAAARLYAVNTTGAILGSLLAGFALIPAIGLRGTLLVGGGVACAAGTAIMLGAAGPRRRVAAAVIAVASVISLAAAPRWNDALLSSGAYKYAPYLRTLDLREALEAGTVLYYREGASGTVSVRRSGGALSLAIDGKIDASTGGDMLTQKLLAHLPLLIHPNPKRVAVVGLGSGVTAGAALTHPLESLEVIEISPEVVEASRLFDPYSGRPLSDPRARLIVGDARTHFTLQRQDSSLYDVIISEPSNPWMAGVAALFTREFFEASSARLASGGIMCQWAHTYDISDADLRAIVGTFRRVFADTTLWLIGDADLLLIGRLRAAGDPGAAIELGFERAAIAADLATVNVKSPFSILSLFAGDSVVADKYAGNTPVETDDRLRLEFSGPRSIVGRSSADNGAALRALTRSGGVPPSIATALDRATAADWASRGAMILDAAAAQAYEDFRRAVAGGDDGALSGLRESATASGRIAEAIALLRRVADERPSSSAPLIELSRLLAATGDTAGALSAAHTAVGRSPLNPRAHQQIASVLADAGDVDRLAAALARLRSLDPSGADTRHYTAVVAFMRGDFQGAVREGEATVALDPKHAKARNLVGAARASLGDLSAAREAFAAAIAIDPQDPSPYVNLGRLHLQTGQADAAAAVFSEALSVRPDSADAREGLAAVLELRGQSDRAARLRSRQLERPLPQRR